MLTEDPRARKILTTMHWSSAGWRQLAPAPDDYDYARNAGYLFDPVEFGHDDLIGLVKAMAAAVDMTAASDAFLASLTSRRLYLRPFLVSAVVARSMPAHGFEHGRQRGRCRICGRDDGRRAEDLNILNFERHKWGGVRILDPLFVWFCLDRFAAEGGAEATDADRAALRALVGQLRALPPGTSATKAEPALRHLPSSKDERLILIEQLSAAGVLEDPGHPGFRLAFIPHEERELPNLRFMDRGYPAQWWSSDRGVNADAVRALFGII